MDCVVSLASLSVYSGQRNLCNKKSEMKMLKSQMEGHIASPSQLLSRDEISAADSPSGLARNFALKTPASLALPFDLHQKESSPATTYIALFLVASAAERTSKVYVARTLRVRGEVEGFSWI